MPRVKSSDTFRFNPESEVMVSALKETMTIDGKTKPWIRVATERQTADGVKPYVVKLSETEKIPVTRYSANTVRGALAMLGNNEALLLTAVNRFVSANQDAQIRGANMTPEKMFGPAVRKGLITIFKSKYNIDATTDEFQRSDRWKNAFAKHLAKAIAESASAEL